MPKGSTTRFSLTGQIVCLCLDAYVFIPTYRTMPGIHTATCEGALTQQAISCLRNGRDVAVKPPHSISGEEDIVVEANRDHG